MVQSVVSVNTNNDTCSLKPLVAVGIITLVICFFLTMPTVNQVTIIVNMAKVA